MSADKQYEESVELTQQDMDLYTEALKRGLIKNPKLRRSFRGNFALAIQKHNTPESSFQKKHLKAYLQGKKILTHKREKFLVQQSFN
jgi:hypothetical protein